MIKIIGIIILLLIILITITAIGDKIKLIKKIKNKINDYFDVRKYRKKANTFENDANTERKERIVALETVQTLVIQNMEKDKTIIKQKAEIKELKRIIAEEMIPRKRKKKDDKKIH